MRQFLDQDFLLESETAKKLYHNHAAGMPIYDYHNHLSAQEIYEDRKFTDLAQAWLGGDHYKWRSLRANGVPEAYITGEESSSYEKFRYWAQFMPSLFGNPLYHWTHLELQRYFEIYEPLTEKSLDRIWESCNEKLKQDSFSVRNLIRRMNVEVLCTTDDPVDDLKYHKLLKEDFEVKVLPTFRPEQAMGIEKETFSAYLDKLGQASGRNIEKLSDLLEVLSARIRYFHEAGCRISDHSLDGNIYAPADLAEIEEIFEKAVAGGAVSDEQIRKYRGYLLTELGKEYQRYGWAMQIHIGALRNNSARMFGRVGADAGFDSLDDFSYAPQLSGVLDALDVSGQLPKTILYCLNPKDNAMLAAMAGNFQSDGIRGKVQFGAAWWFCDHKRGMEEQLSVLSEIGVLSSFVGMLTDSRSFLSFPRHEYFRRILCNFIGRQVENGEYPPDMEYLGGLVEDICYRNAKKYFAIGR